MCVVKYSRYVHTAISVDSYLTVYSMYPLAKPQPDPISTETAKIWSLSSADVLDNDIVSALLIINQLTISTPTTVLS